MFQQVFIAKKLWSPEHDAKPKITLNHSTVIQRAIQHAPIPRHHSTADSCTGNSDCGDAARASSQPANPLLSHCIAVSTQQQQHHQELSSIGNKNLNADRCRCRAFALPSI